MSRKKAGTQKFDGRLSRRKVLKGAAAVAGAAAVGLPAPYVHAARSIKIGVYGGYFKESFDEFIFPDFSKAAGIDIESVAEPTGETWLVQLRNAAKAGIAPADISMLGGFARLRGAAEELWLPLDESQMTNATKYLSDNFVYRYPDGRLYGVGAVSWYITLCSNTDVYPEAPTSWADMWDPKYEDSLGLLALATNSYLLEITAQTFFDVDMMTTQEGIEKIMAKLAEVRPNVRLWYKDEGTFQQALQDGEIPMGQYYHDVTELARADGFPVRSTFPKEGGVIDSGGWVVSKASKKQEEAQVFMDYTSLPEIQAKLSRNVGTAPVMDRKHLDLTDDEFASVSSDIAPIIPQYHIYLKWGDWISDRWTEMISG